MAKHKLACTECRENFTVCDRCRQDPTVAHECVSLTSIETRIFHVAVCPLHGRITKECPTTRPLIEARPIDPIAQVQRTPREEVIRAGAACFAVGVLLGALGTLFLIPWLMHKVC